MAPDDRIREPEQASEFPHLILVEIFQRFDQLTGFEQFHHLIHPVVVGFDDIRVFASPGFDDVRIKRPLPEHPLFRIQLKFLEKPFAHPDEYRAHLMPFLLGIGESCQRLKELFAEIPGFDVRITQISVTLHDLL